MAIDAGAAVEEAERGTRPLRKLANRLLFGIGEREARFDRRGFPAPGGEKQRRLEDIGRAFVCGYREALEADGVGPLASRLDRTPPSHRGFAYEGAAMGLALTDLLWREQRFRRFLHGPAAPHRYMAHVGYGWAVARAPWLRRRPRRTLEGHAPSIAPLILDGYGFHAGYFHPRSTVAQAHIPAGLDEACGKVFDQGLGRCLWFYAAADPDRVGAAIAGFPIRRRGDLWSGVGLAAAYTGIGDETDSRRLLALAGPHVGDVRQGAAFAAEAREAAGIPTPDSTRAASVLCGAPASAAAAIAREEERIGAAGLDAYEAWRTRIRRRLETAAPTGRLA